MQSSGHYPSSEEGEVMSQHTVQLSNYGATFAERINWYLEKNPGWKVAQIHSIQIHKVGGIDTQVIVVFEASDDSVGKFKDN